MGIAVLDIISTIGFLVAFVVILRARGPVPDRYSKTILALAIFVYVAVGLSNVLEHGNITAYFDTFEDFLEILFFPFLLFFFYSTRTHREIRERERAEALLQRAYHDLEKNIQERTADLKTANELLTLKIDEHKRTEEKLQSSEKRFRMIAENIQDGLMIVEHGEATYINDRVCEIFGRSREEIRSGNPLDFVAPEDIELVRETMAAARSSGTLPAELEYWIVGRDGSRKCINSRYTVKDRGRDFIDRYVVTTDITARKQAENELKSSKDFLENIFKTTGEAIIVSNAEGYIERVNTKTNRMFGYVDNELIGRHFVDLASDHHSKDAYPPIVQRLFQKGSVENYETVYKRKDGSTFTAEINMMLLNDAEGAMCGSVCSIRDITLRKKIEKEKEAFEAALQDTIKELSIKNEISEVLLGTRDLDEVLHMILIGATAHQALGFNRAFLFLVNESQGVLEGKVATGFLSADKAYRTWEALKRQNHSLTELFKIRDGRSSTEDEPINTLVKKIKIPLRESSSIFTQAIHTGTSCNVTGGKSQSAADRTVFDLLGTDTLAVVPLISRERNIGVLLADNFINRKPIADEDIGHLQAFANLASLAIENSRLYEDLRQKVAELSSAYNQLQINRDKLLHSERLSAIGNMAAQVAHDIRNPMTVIGGFARRVLKQSREGPETIDIHYIEIIIKEIDRLENILNDLLSFTNPDTPQRSPVHLNKIVQEIATIFSLELEQKHITLSGHYDHSLPVLYLDEGLIRRALINIIKNSIDAVPDGGSVTVSTAHQDQTQTAQVIVDDTGTGISEQDMQKLCEPFFTTKSTGSGLGLTISSQIVQGHSGSITFAKRDPAGMRVTVTLPEKTPA